MYNQSLTTSALVLSLLLSHPAYAEQLALPDPLSLQQAIELIDEQHPALLQARMPGQYAHLDLREAQANNSVRVDLDGRLRWTDSQTNNPVTDDPEDHRLALVVSKPLYDGGKTAATKQAAEFSGQSAEIEYAYSKQQHAIRVMEQFFNIILADLRVARDTEDMSTVFVRMDRAEDHLELGRISDVDMLALRSEYQDARVRLYASEGDARKTRQELALSLNRPGEQPSQVTPPTLDVNGRSLKEFDALREHILKNNPQLIAMNHRIEAARARVEAERSRGKPRVTALLERAEQSRDLSSADKWRVGMEMSMPLYDGGISNVAVRRASLDMNQLIYQRHQYEIQVRQEVRDIVERYRTLKATRDASVAFFDYRELYMDRSRALYELEVKTDLGNAMVLISDAQIRDARQQFDMTLLLAQLNLLAGEEIMNWDAFTTKDVVQEGEGT